MQAKLIYQQQSLHFDNIRSFYTHKLFEPHQFTARSVHVSYNLLHIMIIISSLQITFWSFFSSKLYLDFGFDIII